MCVSVGSVESVEVYFAVLKGGGGGGGYNFVSTTPDDILA